MTGSEVISELIFELDASAEAASGFEGEMQRLAGYARRACCFATLMLSEHRWNLNVPLSGQ